MRTLLEDIKIKRVMNAVAAGTSSQTGSAVDMAQDGGYDGVLFVAMFGALTATQVTSLKAQQSADDGSADSYADLDGAETAALEDTDGNKCLVLDVFRPAERYVKPTIVRGTANAVIDGMLAILYRGRQRPSLQDTTVAQALAVVTPDEESA